MVSGMLLTFLFCKVPIKRNELVMFLTIVFLCVREDFRHDKEEETYGRL